MASEVIICPQCGGRLEDVCEAGFYTCPYCKSRIKVTFAAPDPNLMPDGRTKVFDTNTGVELGCVKLSRGWQATGCIVRNMQSSSWPFAVLIHAESLRHDAAIDSRSGAAFKEIITSPTARHVEGCFDQLDLMPMRKQQSAAQYADVFFSAGISRGTRAQLLETRALPVLPLPDFNQKRNETLTCTRNMLRAYTPMGMSASVDAATYEGCTRIYRFEENGQEYRQAVATLIDGVQISFAPAMMSFFGGKNSYRTWGSQYLVTLKALPEVFEQYYDNFVMFCSTMQASTTIVSSMEQERSSIMGGLKQQQADRFSAQQKMVRDQQASFDAYNRAWKANSDSQFNASRSAAERQASEDRLSDLRSEAIRGVNTYIRPDGTEVEYSVVSEAAFANVNDSHDTFATESRNFESVDWIEMKKKY